MRFTHALLSLCAVALLAPIAAADGLVLESYVGPRPADATQSLKGVMEELARRDFSPTTALQIESKVSRAALSDVGLPVDFAPQVDKGQKEWVTGSFDAALATLQPLVTKAHENPAAFAKDQKLREKLFRAQMGIAISHLKKGDAGTAKTVFAEILRSFPDMPVSRSVYGPDIAVEYDKVKRELDGMKRGALTVKFIGEAGPIYLNEKFENAGQLVRTDLYPGEYRVFATTSNGPTRLRKITIAAGANVTLNIDAQFDRALQVKGDWVGLAFASEQDRIDNEPLYAAKLADELDKDQVIVVSVDSKVLIGAIIDKVSKKDLRRGTIDKSTPRGGLGLAKFLTSGDLVEGVDVRVGGSGTTTVVGNGGGGGSGERPLDRGPAPSSGGIWGGWKWLGLTATVGALGVGGTLLYLDGSCPTTPPPGMRCAELRDFKVGGWATVAGGGVVGIVTVILFARGSGGSSTRTGYVVPTQGGAYAGFSMRF